MSSHHKKIGESVDHFSLGLYFIHEFSVLKNIKFFDLNTYLLFMLKRFKFSKRKKNFLKLLIK